MLGVTVPWRDSRHQIPVRRAATASPASTPTDDLVSSPFPFEAGVLGPPEGPGLGVVIDEDRLMPTA